MIELFNNIKSIISSTNKNYITILGFAVTIFVVFLTSYLTTKTNKKNTTNDYFKKEGIANQREILDFWSNLLIYNDYKIPVAVYKKAAKLEKNLSLEDTIKIIQQESIIYSSKETNAALATYLQFSYKKDNSDSKALSNTLLKKIRNVQIIILVLRIVKRMKYDFTGEKIDTLDLLKIRIKDLNIKKKILARYFIIYYFIKERFLKLLSLALIITLVLIFLS